MFFFSSRRRHTRFDCDWSSDGALPITHSYLDLSPGRDFETEIFYKPNAVELLRAELASPRYEVSPIALGTNTDPYQPVERELNVTRSILELLLELKHPATIVTKGALI